jgi:hypothetical protein
MPGYTRIIITLLFHQVEGDLQQPLPRLIANDVKVLAKTLPGIGENFALKSLASNEEPSVLETIELMGSLLYQPGRYQDVIDLGGKLSVTQATQRAEYWLYLAAAFGQKYHALKLTGSASQEELESVKENVMDCTRRAIRIDPSMRARLWFISDPDGDDGDLADFGDDREFLRLVGKGAKTGSQVGN